VVTGHVSTSIGAVRFRTSHHGRCCEANQATAADIVANGLSIPMFLLTTTVDVMAPALARLANLSFSTGVFPSRYKLGHVTPLLKKPGLCSIDPANFRPVTNHVTFFQDFWRTGALSHATARPLVGSVNLNRSAYRPGHSTETAPLKVVGYIQRAGGVGKCTVLLAFEISAAFDAVDHSVLGDVSARTLPSTVPSVDG